MREIPKAQKEIVLITAGALALGSAAVTFVLKNRDRYAIFAQAEGKMEDMVQMLGAIPIRAGYDELLRKKARRIILGPDEEPYDDTDAEQSGWPDDDDDNPERTK